MTGNESSNIVFLTAKAVYDWCTATFAKYLGDADFYQYSIVTSVATGNLTVALKNYLGADPSASAPVKYKDSNGVIRTITSALSWTDNAGINYANAGSAELATKEIDFFVYLNFRTSNSTFYIGYSRYPNANYV
jgi:hypothetical protein